MKVKKVRTIADELDAAAKGVEYTDLCQSTISVNGGDWRYTVVRAAMNTAHQKLEEARQAFRALAHIMDVGEGELHNPAVVNRLGHWACGDCPPVFADTVPLPKADRPTTF